MKKVIIIAIAALSLSSCSVCQFTTKQAYCAPDGDCVIEGCVICRANVKDASKVLFSKFKK